MKKLPRSFYAGNTLDVAKGLLGKVLVHRHHGFQLKGKIVEVEAYIGAIDKAAHSYNNRRTERTEVMFGPPGYAYVYMIYGMYHCMNVVTGREGEGSAVLIRALEPVEGIDQMAWNRYGKPLEILKRSQKINLTNGPGKLCRAMGITKDNYGDDLLGDQLFIEESDVKETFEIGVSKRINIDYAEEAREFEWRFFIQGNPYLSKG
ncbi:DNA-3-methyladenine glycosylase [Thermotalea metallivorans]|uniref:Putative 3-methyladenine DNA glycosylase n=1 Tax=Thermotalea metallivorans TaxID=520762 RepID=A0A140L4K2_9FIRM|nr:DNA-3-methyladenine glycosylase [Thermotalea metallivorans]KXG75477.1 putative 3-methyladenine DNA glycosylase [Thermotalea metallivorans]